MARFYRSVQTKRKKDHTTRMKLPQLKRKNTKKSRISLFCSSTRNLYAEKRNQQEGEEWDKTDKMACK